MIIPVILEENFDEIVKKVQVAEKKAKRIQIDVADGLLVNGHTFTHVDKLATIKSTAELEIHLMIVNPVKFIENHLQNVKRMCSQVETDHNDFFVKEAKRMGYKVGLSVGIDTNIGDILRYIPLIDYVQFLGVSAGGQGRQIEPTVLDKITLFKREYPKMETQIDGGVHLDNLDEILKTGVDNVVVGSALFGSGDFNANYEAIEAKIKKFKEGK